MLTTNFMAIVNYWKINHQKSQNVKGGMMTEYRDKHTQILYNRHFKYRVCQLS